MKLNSIAYNGDAFEIVIVDTDRTFKMEVVDLAENESDKASMLAIGICGWLQSNDKAIREFCAAKLLELKNETWLDDGEAPLSVEEFCERMGREGILAFSDGSFQLFFDDHDIFWGHGIVVDVAQDFVLDDATIAG